MGIFLNIGVGLLTTLIGVLLGRTWERAKILRRYGHIRALLGRQSRIQIIVSRVEIQRFKFVDDTAITNLQVPPNVLYMPMPEGRAIAELTSVLHRLNRGVRVQLVTAKDYNPELPTISIGGPSVNAFTGRVLNTEFPDFRIEYPATRRARYEDHVFETRRGADNSLIRDHGFIFLTRTTRGAPCLIFCGIRAFGTAMAVELFLSLGHQSEAARLIRKGKKVFMAADGQIDGLQETNIRLGFCRELPATVQRP